MKKGKVYTLGDVHGGYLALMQVLGMVDFDYENDTLITLGDLCDGWSQTPEVIEELKKIKNLVAIRGNHDHWAMLGLKGDGVFTDYQVGCYTSWIRHGGIATEYAYSKLYPELKEDHIDFLENVMVDYYVDDQNRLFVHAGFDIEYPIGEQDKSPMNDTYMSSTNGGKIYYLNRHYWKFLFPEVYDGDGKWKHEDFGKDFKEIYIGHTPTTSFPKLDDNNSEPMNMYNIWNLDTGAAFKGKLTIMDVDTKEYWQSDRVYTLYPNEKGRN